MISDDLIFAINSMQNLGGFPDYYIESLLDMESGRLKRIKEFPTIMKSSEINEIIDLILKYQLIKSI